MVRIYTYTPKYLSHLVKSFWYLEVSTDAAVPYEEDIIPDGHHEMIFHLPPFTGRRKFHDTGWIDEPAAFIAGQTMTSYTIQLMPGAKLYGIRFYPHTLAAFLGMPVPVTTTGMFPLDNVLCAAPFWNCMATTPEQTFSALDKMLSPQSASQLPGHDYVSAAVQKIMETKGNISGERLLAKTGISTKHLDTLFRKHVGLTPKVMSNIIRLNHFIASRNTFPAKSLTECGYETGYYDQSHLIRSFHQYAHKSPKAYFNSPAYINDYFVHL